MTTPHCYIKAAALVSCQKPLSDDWLTEPMTLDRRYVRAQEPDSKAFIVPSEARRMSKILKRAVCTSLTALNEAGIEMPDAIITGTGAGCMETSEKFLIDLSRFGENCLKPTLFMQSTHNTISSLIAIIIGCHGYNNTYSHGDASFESALLDSLMQMQLGQIRNALVGAHDEVTPLMSLVMERTHPAMQLVSETSMSMAVSTDCRDALCEVESVTMLHRATPAEVAEAVSECAPRPGLLMLGTNGNPANDAPYDELLAAMGLNGTDTLAFKSTFGENHSASGAGAYAAVRMLSAQNFPPHMWRSGAGHYADATPVERVTVINRGDNSTWTVVTLKRV